MTKNECKLTLSMLGWEHGPETIRFRKDINEVWLRTKYEEPGERNIIMYTGHKVLHFRTYDELITEIGIIGI